MPQSTVYTQKQIWDTYRRRITTKSNYKMPCSCCGETINRGDKITQVIGTIGKLRTRGQLSDVVILPARSQYNFTSYTPSRNSWVHLNCRPSYWYTYGWSPLFTAGGTHYSESIQDRRNRASFDPDWSEDWCEIPNPEWKYESDRIEKGVVATFQALWRGYRTRKEYKAISWLAAHGSALSNWDCVEICCRRWFPKIVAAIQIQRIWLGYQKRTVFKTELAMASVNMPVFPIGTSVSILFDKNTEYEKPWKGTIVSRVDKATIMEIRDWTDDDLVPCWYVVKYDIELRKRIYQHDHLVSLIEECEKRKARYFQSSNSYKEHIQNIRLAIERVKKTGIRRRPDRYEVTANALKALFPETGYIIPDICGKKAWRNFCKPYKPIKMW